MSSTAPLLLSGFADEAANQKTIDQQFSVLAALGMRYFSIRFIDAGNGVKNVMTLNKDEIDLIKEKLVEYGLTVSSIGSPIGKTKLCDVDDGTSLTYRPFETYVKEDVVRACELANSFGTKLLRGFSFYHPKGSDIQHHLAQAVDQVGTITDVCDSHGLTYGLEVEANLVGQTGQLLAEMHQQIARDALVTIFDGGNLVMQGFSAEEVYQQYLAMKPGLGWIHIKDFKDPDGSERVTHVDEESIKHFVPSDIGQSGHTAIMKDFANFLPELHQRITARGVPGVFADMEPHVKGGGQFGGFSGPDGFGVALRAFCRVCDDVGISYRLRDFSDIRADRGF